MARFLFVWSCILVTLPGVDVWADTGAASVTTPSPTASLSPLSPPVPVTPNSNASNAAEPQIAEPDPQPSSSMSLMSPSLTVPNAAADSAPTDATRPHWAPVIIEPLSLFVVMRGTEAYLWPNPFSLRRTNEWPRHYREAFSMPPKFDSSRSFMEWDGDRWQINVIGHGLLGSELYLRPRRCGISWLGSFAIAAGASTIWEFGIEANGVRPSAVDLVYTPLSGILIGEARFQAWRASNGLSNRTWRSLLRIFFDPVGEFDTGVLNGPC